MTLHENFSTCRTFRRFYQKPVPHDLICRALDLARTATCAKNAQVLRYVAVTDPDTVAAIQPLVRWAAQLPPELGTPKDSEKPTAFIAIVKTAEAGALSDIDVGIAAHTVMTALWDEGVGGCMMAAIDAPAISQILQIPDENTLRLLLSIGYPSHESRVIEPDGSLHYRLDNNKNYLVPKLPFDDVVTFQ